MKKVSCKDIARFAKGHIIAGDAERVISEVITDSRKALPGKLFVALKGENHDGHDFLKSAYLSGITAVLISNEEAAGEALNEARKEAPDIEPVIIVVADTVKGLAEMAKGYLSTFDIRKVGVTGSTGKTSTKDMLYCVLSVKYNTAKTMGNFNNEIGLPLTVLSLDEDVEAVVLEMGMSAFGEIHYLVDIARPDIGVITNVGISHMENLGSREGILKAKLEIKDYFTNDNLLIIYDDGDVLNSTSAAGDYRLKSVGYKSGSTFEITEVTDLGADGIEYELKYNDRQYHVELPAPGVHNASNSALALAAGLEMGVSLEEGIKGLLSLELTNGRLSIIERDGIRVIDDTYNASPDSMKAGLGVLAATRASRRIAILGDMYELGDESVSWHNQVGVFAGEKNIDLVVAIGENAAAIAEGARKVLGEDRVLYFKEKAQFIEIWEDYIKDGDVILVKASRGMHMEEIVNTIISR